MNAAPIPPSEAPADDVEIYVQPTPNPRARKFICDRAVKNFGSEAYEVSDAPQAGPLLGAILRLPHITHAFTAYNILTLTQDGTQEWDELEPRLCELIRRLLPQHDPDQSLQAGVLARPAPPDTPEIRRISGILDQTIRPYVESHGGQLDIVAYDETSKRLTVGFEGACDACPASTGGTLQAVASVLREEYDEDLTVDVDGASLLADDYLY